MFIVRVFALKTVLASDMSSVPVKIALDVIFSWSDLDTVPPRRFSVATKVFAENIPSTVEFPEAHAPFVVLGSATSATVITTVPIS